MNNTQSRIIIALFSFVPYLLVSWAYVALVNGDSRQFWQAMGILLLVRLFFAIIEFLGNILSWRLFGKKAIVQNMLAFLRTNNFPKREYAHDDFLNYLARIEDGEDYSASIKASAREFEFILTTFESMGILLGARMHSASETALELFSPRVQAPMYGAVPAKVA